MTPFEQGAVMVLFVEAMLCFAAAFVKKRFSLLVLSLILTVVLVLVRLTVHLSVEWVP